MDRAQQFGFDGVELDCRAPHALPYLLSIDDRKEIADYIGEKGLGLAALAANNDFSSPVTEHRDANVQMVVEMIRLCRDLGAPVLRIFTAWQGSGFLNGRGTYEVARPGYAMAFPQIPEMDQLEVLPRCVPDRSQVCRGLWRCPGAPGTIPQSCGTRPTASRWPRRSTRPISDSSFDISGERAWQQTDWLLQQAHLIGDRWAHSHFAGDFRRNEEGVVERVPASWDVC